MKPARILSLSLATLLQVLPLLRTALPAQITGTSAWAIVLKLGAGAVALLGSYHAVSAASTIVPNGGTYNLTAGVSTNINIGYSGSHVPLSWSANPNPVAPGMKLNNASGSSTTLAGTPTTPGTYSTTIICWENANFSGRNATANFTFIVAASLPPPVITNITLSGSGPFAPGSSVTLGSVVGGTGPYFYRWLFNGRPIPGGTNATLPLTNLQGAGSGTYALIVRNNTSGSGTNSTNVIVNSSPAINVQPENQYVAPGGSTSLSVVAGGAEPMSYQWRLYGTNLPGAAARSLSLNGIQRGQAGLYSVVVSNALGTATSVDAYVRLSSSATTAVIPLLQMTNNWRYDVTGVNRLKSWREFDYDDSAWSSGKGLFALETSGNTAVFPFIGTTLPLNGGGHYLTNIYFRTHFTITNRGRLTGMILSNVVDDGVIVFLNGNEVSRGTNMPWGEITVTTRALSAAQEGVFVTTNLPADFAVAGDNVIAADLHQNAATSSDSVLGLALLGVYSVPNTIPLILTNPASATPTPGATVTLRAEAEGTANLQFRWYKGGTQLGSTSNTLTLNNVQAADAGDYTFVASNPFGSSTSQVATLSFGVSEPPVLVTDLADQIVPSGTNLVLAIGATGNNLTYQWSFNSNQVNNATGPTLSLNNLQPAQSGFYSVTVSNAGGGFQSRQGRLLVIAPPLPETAPRLAPVVGSGSATFNFTTQPGYRYLLQRSSEIGGTNWITVTNIPASFTPGTISWPQLFSESPSLFYRVIISQ